jgi:hypothetical protein
VTAMNGSWTVAAERWSEWREKTSSRLEEWRGVD